MQHLFRLYRFGDSFLIPEALIILEYNLITPTVPPLTKILSLKMLNELWKCGEYDVVDFCKKMVPWLGKMIEDVDGMEVGMKRGEKMF